MHNLLSEENALDLNASIAWSVQDDRGALEGATVDQIRSRFTAWVASDAARAEQPDSTQLTSSPRYQYCIHVDDEALDSVVRLAPRPPETDFEGVGYVNLVDGLWSDDADEPEVGDEDDAGDGQNPDDEDDEAEVGWMRVCADGLHPSVYSALLDRGMYYVMYKKPPQVCVR